MLTSACKNEHLRTPPSDCFIIRVSSEYCEIFKSTYFEEHLRTAASKNVFIKKIVKLFIRSFKCTLKNRLFRYQYQKQVKMFVFISWLVSHEVCIHIQTIFLWCGNTKYLELIKRRSKVQKNMSCERALNFDQWKL